MPDETDSGIDRRKILDEIGEIPSTPDPSPTPVVLVPSSSMDLPMGGLAEMAPPTLTVAPPPPVPLARLRTRWHRHRRQIAALVLVFVSLLWFAVGLATEERAPFGLGGTFLGIAVLIGVGSLVRDI
jgi:hypothetical protein